MTEQTPEDAAFLEFLAETQADIFATLETRHIGLLKTVYGGDAFYQWRFAHEVKKLADSGFKFVDYFKVMDEAWAYAGPNEQPSAYTGRAGRRKAARMKTPTSECAVR